MYGCDVARSTTSFFNGAHALQMLHVMQRAHYRAWVDVHALLGII